MDCAIFYQIKKNNNFKVKFMFESILMKKIDTFFKKYIIVFFYYFFILLFFSYRLYFLHVSRLVNFN